MYWVFVVVIVVLDGCGCLLFEFYEVLWDLVQVFDMQGGYVVFIVFEEQFKVFILFKVSVKIKFKLMVYEGCCVCKVVLVMFVSVVCEDYVEICLVCFINLGDVYVFLVFGL